MLKNASELSYVTSSVVFASLANKRQRAESLSQPGPGESTERVSKSLNQSFLLEHGWRPLCSRCTLTPSATTDYKRYFPDCSDLLTTSGSAAAYVHKCSRLVKAYYWHSRQSTEKGCYFWEDRGQQTPVCDERIDNIDGGEMKLGRSTLGLSLSWLIQAMVEGKLADWQMFKRVNKSLKSCRQMWQLHNITSSLVVNNALRSESSELSVWSNAPEQPQLLLKDGDAVHEKEMLR